MEGEVSFEALRRVQLSEKNSPALTNLESDFYVAYQRHMQELHKRLSGDFSLEAARAYESTRKVLTDIARRREQKILLKALHDFETGGIGSDGFAIEEKELYTSLIKLISVYQPGSLEQVPSTRREQKVEEEPLQSGSVLVKLLVDIPQFVGSGGPVGPFAAGSQAQVSDEDAALLVSQGAAQTI